MEIIRRSALILYSIERSTTSNRITIFAGVNQGELTSIGGRKEARESEMECLIREIKEETKDIVDYTNCPEILSTALSRKCNGFYDVCVETTRERMTEIREQFLSTISGKRESNELSSLELIDLDQLIKSYILKKDPPSRPDFKKMLLDVGYDAIVSRFDRKINYYTDKMNIRVNFYAKIGDLPEIVSMVMFNDNLPNVYAKIQSNGFFITDQYYFEDREGRWFRSGLVSSKSG
jgi:8-oxo-dGTP pyrophosphatase MutT (NUDIX family)